MAAFAGKQWFRDNISPYLSIIKCELEAIGSITGQYVGKGATFVTLPDIAVETTTSGDWSILTVDDIGTGDVDTPQYPAGIYYVNAAGTDWELVQENQDIADVLRAIIATPAEVTTGTATDKVASVAELNAQYAKLNGLDTELFNATSGELNSTNVLTANQFADADVVVQSDACADWGGVICAGDPCAAPVAAIAMLIPSFDILGTVNDYYSMGADTDKELTLRVTGAAEVGFTYPITVVMETLATSPLANPIDMTDNTPTAAFDESSSSSHSTVGGFLTGPGAGTLFVETVVFASSADLLRFSFKANGVGTNSYSSGTQHWMTVNVTVTDSLGAVGKMGDLVGYAHAMGDPALDPTVIVADDTSFSVSYTGTGTG